MKTYNLEFTKRGEAFFRNENNRKDKIFADDVLRFGTVWTSKKEDYQDADGFFEDCNCFIQGSYSVTFCQLSGDGEELICNL